jgi:methyl-accepting chemotaxis protein
MRVFKAFRMKDAALGTPKEQNLSTLEPEPSVVDHSSHEAGQKQKLDALVQSVQEDVAHNCFQWTEALRTSDQAGEDAHKQLGQIPHDMEQLLSSSHDAAQHMDGIFLNIQELTQFPSRFTDIFQQELPHLQRVLEGQETSLRIAQRFDQVAQGLSELVDIIASLARQTNLVALQTTIEGTRAGASGQDLSALAAQMKSLSRDAEQASRLMNHRIKDLREETASFVYKAEAVQKDSEMASKSIEALREAASRKDESIHHLAGHAAAIVGYIKTTSDTASRTTAGSMRTKTAFEAAVKSSHGLFKTGLKLHHSLSETIQNSLGDKLRRYERMPASWPARLVTLGMARKEWETTTIDVSEDGVLLQKPKHGQFEPGMRLDIALQSGPPLPCEVIALSQLGLHVQFLPCEASNRHHYQSLIETLRQDYAPLIRSAQKLVFEIQAKLEKEAIQDGFDWFDTGYRPIPGSSPCQYETSYLSAAEVILPDVLDAPLASNDELIFCVMADRHGYVPVHNRKYAQAPRLNDPYWNMAHCRNKRFFDDATGLAAVRSQSPYLLQNYLRDMGGGVNVLMREIDVPLSIHGRHWGALRMGYKL